jgi:hypothetical protein
MYVEHDIILHMYINGEVPTYVASAVKNVTLHHNKVAFEYFKIENIFTS